MGKFTNFDQHLQLAIVIVALGILLRPVNGQYSSSMCTGAMISNFSPCISFLASGSNTSSPSSECCSSLKDLMSNGQDCLCLMVTGGSSFQVPLNRTLAISLPRACRMSGVPIECKDQSGSLAPPTSYAPPSGGPLLPQPSPPAAQRGGIVTLTPPGMRPYLLPSAAQPCHSAFPSLFVAILAVILANYH